MQKEKSSGVKFSIYCRVKWKDREQKIDIEIKIINIHD